MTTQVNETEYDDAEKLDVSLALFQQTIDMNPSHPCTLLYGPVKGGVFMPTAQLKRMLTAGGVQYGVASISPDGRLSASCYFPTVKQARPYMEVVVRTRRRIRECAKKFKLPVEGNYEWRVEVEAVPFGKSADSIQISLG